MGFEVGIAPANGIRHMGQLQRQGEPAQFGPVLDHGAWLTEFARWVMGFEE